MLNRVGQRLLQLFEGASAAYSLRDLASNIASVVRVRRASDNSEKDFSAADVSSGAMTQWVNAQIVPPLDVRELVDGERTGDLVEAAAAYSLRNLSTSYTGNVVDVRRSSDDAEESFTAAEVADGTLEDWVNEDLGITFETAEPVSSSIPGATVTNASSTGFTYSSSDTVVRGARIPFSQSIPAGATISVTITTSNKVGGVSPSVRFASNSGGQLGVSATPGTLTSNADGTQTFVGTTISNTTSLGFFDNVAGSFDVSDVTINYIRYNGFVTQWYDQSGNGNHATQGTPASQPKIVDAGSLVSGGLSIGSGQHLSTTLSGTTFALNNASSFVLGAASGGQGVGALTAIHSPSIFSSPYRFSSTQGFRYGGESASSQPRNNSVQLFTLIGGSTTAEGFANGTSYRSTASSSSAYTNPSFKIGSYSANLIKGEVAELIIYDSDQSDNRTAFEANIGETYGIDLPSGVDTGYDQVDGFVETWYDQSGNGNDAVQSVAGSQPKIVDAGVLLNEIKFDGVDDFMLSDVSTSGDDTTVLVAKNNSTTGGSLFLDNQSGTPKALYVTSTYFQAYYGTASDLNYGSLNNDDNLHFISTNATDSNNRYGSLNGIVDLLDSGTRNYTSLSIGISRTGTSPLNGSIKELIIYDSDQSDNRTAIEANINNQYDIY